VSGTGHPPFFNFPHTVHCLRLYVAMTEEEKAERALEELLQASPTPAGYDPRPAAPCGHRRASGYKCISMGYR
jgi:hypothetical protein